MILNPKRRARWVLEWELGIDIYAKGRSRISRRIQLLGPVWSLNA